ncbi:MAG: PD-(D/E)XK nuclease family protein [Bacteroidia bacterium]|nr:PD-(D/E)XK nuclease family protein [Bacteroidia bacterium]
MDLNKSLELSVHSINQKYGQIMKPNIFNISTKELSQDGFFTWLLQWADPENSKYNKELFNCGQAFVKKLITKQMNQEIEIRKVETNRQLENIDVSAKINNEILIIIEDKTFTKEHSNQLETYKNIGVDWCTRNNYKLVCIYLKTGSEALVSIDNVKNKGFAVVDRRELIKFFKEHSFIKNDIFQDFNERLKSLELSENSYNDLIIKKWERGGWAGFYQFLQTNINVIGWGYVANPAGGFLGLCWHFLEWKDYRVYLQIEEGNLCFKIGKVNDNRRNVRNEWFSIIMKHAKEKGNFEIVKPQRFGNGTYMTVAIIERKDWLGNDNDILDKEKVVKKLKEYEKFLDECIKG